MAKYEGLIGKLSQDIFEGSGQGNLGVAKYAGLGSLAGAGVGGTHKVTYQKRVVFKVVL